jgi:formylglycine-generating enzyme required for sulfatase activity
MSDAGRAYTYESVTVDEYGKTLTQVRFTTPTYQELQLDGPNGLVSIPVISVSGGQFVLGAPDTELGRDPSQPAQTIATVEPFWMSLYPITQQQWRAVAMLSAVNRSLESDPADFSGDSLPVEQVSWHEAVEFCDRLNRWLESYPTAFDLRRFRLPTETEWEYACRAKTTTPFHTGQTLTTELANYNGTQPYRREPVGSFRGATTQVGSFKANDFGLYDMHGNVLEWCTPREGVQTKNAWRAVRGGSWQSPPQDGRSAYRAGFKADTRSNQIGFRIVAEAL